MPLVDCPSNARVALSEAWYGPQTEQFGEPLCARRRQFDAKVGQNCLGLILPNQVSSLCEQMRGVARTMQRIQKGFDVFIQDGDKAVGAVRQVYLGGKPEIVIYVENAGDFVVPISAVKDVYAEKVVLNPAALSLELKQALGHAHDVEDPSV